MSGLVPGTYEVVWYEADEDWKWIEIIRDKIDVPPVEARGGQRLSDAAIASARAGANRVLSDLKINRETIEHMLETRIWPVNPRTNQVFTDQHWAEVNRDLAAGGPQFDKAHGLAHDAFQALRRANIRSRGVSPSAQQGQAEVSDEDRRRLEVALEAIDAASAALIEARGVAAV